MPPCMPSNSSFYWGNTRELKLTEQVGPSHLPLVPSQSSKQSPRATVGASVGARFAYRFRTRLPQNVSSSSFKVRATFRSASTKSPHTSTEVAGPGVDDIFQTGEQTVSSA